jgi:multidrug efflux pump subunit AcrB
MSDLTKVVLLLILVFVIIVFGPLITLWSLNTLFPVLSIPYNLATWFAALWVFGFVAYRGSKSK